MSANPDHCYICGLRIPAIATPTYALYGTIDHIVPRAKGGPDRHANRKPSHRICNELKGNRLLSDIELDELDRLHVTVRGLLASAGIAIPERQSIAIRRRLGILEPLPISTQKAARPEIAEKTYRPRE